MALTPVDLVRRPKRCATLGDPASISLDFRPIGDLVEECRCTSWR
jgi:hypothetical protein